MVGRCYRFFHNKWFVFSLLFFPIQCFAFDRMSSNKLFIVYCLYKMLLYIIIYVHVRGLIKVTSYCCNTKILIFFSYSDEHLFLFFLRDSDHPKTKTKKPKFFLSFHWNVNCQLSHNKLSVFAGYNVALRYDTIWISEPYLDSNVPLDDNILFLNGCNLNQVDYPDMSREEVSVCTTRKTLSWELLTLLNSTNVYYVIWLVRIRKVILLLFIVHQVRHCEDFLFNLEKLIN